MRYNEELIRPVEVQARQPYRIWLRFADGTEGEVDLAHLAGKGVFKAWSDPSFFADVGLDDGGAVCWGDSIDLCPDALYMRLTGLSLEEYMPKLSRALTDA
ncbi:MAG: DUF2442 domain-containing protein [bacterium]|nr:DUF2442 domain-containing protein [bacterium]